MIATVLLDAPGGLGSLGSIVPMVLIIIVFYFFMIRPQVKKQKDQKKLVEEIKIGDKVVTTAGIHGKVATVTDTYFLIEVDNNVKIKFDKSAISLDATKALNDPAPVKK
ncbi:preprotein translocase subunit YajC [Mucilaginibacter myungsuensis]|uniref:Sec translocon accessory complex subunit YajC n=1 Tax=Mucilaginibacter myungsuensis TaxID=649104 RepID=A0A929KXK4_9SPHI|nr:preprotein translocase subunit YajC [Mucilaginibacter myungsuensis]MBE9662507.1 preprotein translocase subunit YajC [Mucilaginibacter myungsuensis]MDN3597926.1 preprotein translocase subunit YajC [Mucilaginibacter myungsuensis]